MNHVSLYGTITALVILLIGCASSVMMLYNKLKKAESQIEDIINDRTQIKKVAADYIWNSFNQPEKEPSVRNKLIPMVFTKGNAEVVAEKCNRIYQRRSEAKFKRECRDVSEYRASDPSKYLPKHDDNIHFSAKIAHYDKKTKTAEVVGIKEFGNCSCSCLVLETAEQDVIQGFLSQCDVLFLGKWVYKQNKVTISLATPVM